MQAASNKIAEQVERDGQIDPALIGEIVETSGKLVKNISHVDKAFDSLISQFEKLTI
jgi:hypothetical protein